MNSLQSPYSISLQTASAKAEFSAVQPALIVGGAFVQLSVPTHDTQTAAGRELSWVISGVFGELTCSVIVRSTEKPGGVIVSSRVANTGSAPARLDFFRPINLRAEMGGHLMLGADTRRLKVFVMTSHTGGYGTRVEDLSVDLRAVEHAIRDRTSGIVSRSVIALHVPGGPSLVAGALDFRVQDAVFSLLNGNSDGTPSGQIREFSVELEHFKPVQPGESVDLAPIWLAVGDDPLALLEQYADGVSQQMNIKLTDAPPCGWISWYGYRTALTEEHVRANADIQKRTMFALGGTLCHMDLGWNKGDRPGDWLEGNSRFPGGIENLCRQLASDGFQVALWSAPLVVAESSDVFRQHPEWVLRDDRGQALGLGTWYWEPVETFYALDPTLPAVHAHLRHVYQTLRSWGVRAFKTDFALGVWPGTGHEGKADAARLPIRYADPNYTRLEACRKVYSTIRDAIGPDAHMTTCNVPWQGVIGIADSIFLANDVGNLTDAESDDEGRNRRGWDHFEARTRQVFGRYFFHGRTWWGNPDCYVAENDAPENHARARLQAVMLAGGQVKCSNRLPSWKPERMDAFLKGLPLYGKAARPVDLFDSPSPSILDMPIHTPWGEWHVVGVFNWDRAAADKRIDFARLSPAVGAGPQLVWDFWDERLLGEHAGGATIRLPGESATMIGVRPRPSHPVVVATNMHFTMGAVEIVEHRWDESARRLSGRARRCPGAAGDLFIYVPAGYAHSDATALPGGASILRLPLRFDTAECDWQATFSARRRQ